jgi:hypothetical protein
MRTLLVFTLLLCAAACSKSRPHLTCAHPVFYGGGPFEVPEPYYIDGRGAIHFSSPTTPPHKFVMYGAVCEIKEAE